MYEAPGIGLAADPDRRAAAHRHHGPRQEGRAEGAAGFHQPGGHLGVRGERPHEEGCLSIPEYYEEVERPAAVKVRYLDLDGNAAGDRGRRPAGHLPAARDRPPQRRAVHRPPLQAQARHGDQEFTKALEARRDRRAAYRKTPPSTGSSRRRARANIRGLAMPLRLIFMGTPDFAVPTLDRTGRARPRDRRRSIPARRSPPAARHGVAADAGRARGARHSACRCCTPKTLRREEAQAEFAALDADAAVVVAYGLILPKAVLEALRARLLQRACLAAAALARRRADQPRGDGGRCRNRRHHHADGRGPRHRRHGDGRARRRSAPT